MSKRGTGTGVAFVMLGILGMAGAVGKYDFWEECHAAADCVAGDPPNDFVQLLLFILSGALAYIGVRIINEVD
jgi:hypothetical protein